MKDCQWPELEGGGRGRWIQHDKSFGFGLNVARTRHASEIIRTSVSKLNTILQICYPLEERAKKIIDATNENMFTCNASHPWSIF